MVREVTPLVAAVRQRPFLTTPEVQVLDDDAVVATLKAEVQGAVASEQAWLEAVQLHVKHVGGFYDTKSKRVVLRREAVDRQDDLSVKRRIAHELTHALQGQHFDLSRMDAEASALSRDAFIAHQALFEGDAELTEAGVYARLMGRPAGRSMKVTRDSTIGEGGGAAEIAHSVFVYQQGSRFVSALFGAGGMKQVDEAYQTPPRTTWSILHPEAYLEGREPAPPRALELPWADVEASSVQGPALFARTMEEHCGVDTKGAELFVDAARVQNWSTQAGPTETFALLRAALANEAPGELFSDLGDACRKEKPTWEVRALRDGRALHIVFADTKKTADRVLAASRGAAFAGAPAEPRTPKRFPAPNPKPFYRSPEDVRVDARGAMRDDWAGIEGALREASSVALGDSSSTVVSGSNLVYRDGSRIGGQGTGTGVQWQLLDAGLVHEERLHAIVRRIALEGSSTRGGTRVQRGEVHTVETGLGPGAAQDFALHREGEITSARVTLVPICQARLGLVWTEFWSDADGRRTLDGWTASLKAQGRAGKACAMLDEELRGETDGR